MPAQTDRTINVNVSEGSNDFLLLSGPAEIILPAGDTEVLFMVPIDDDSIDEPNGIVTATVLPGTDYTVATKQNTASVNIIDNDGTPVVLINPEPPKKWIEGETRGIHVSSTGVPVGTPVKFRVTDGGTNLYKGAEIRTLIWDSGFNYLRIETNFDFVYEENGVITVEVIPGEGYGKSPINGQLSFTVYDDDKRNNVSIRALDSTITEGQFAQFEFESTVIRYNHSYHVRFLIDQGNGNFIDEFRTDMSQSYWDYLNYNSAESDTKGSVSISSGVKTEIVRIPTIDDNFDEFDGNITLTIYLTPAQEQMYKRFNTIVPNYLLFADQTKNSATVRVLDNDESLPVVSLSSTTTSVVEGATVTMSLTSNQAAPANGLLINYKKRQAGNLFATNFSGSDSVTILSGETTKNLEFETHNDNLDEPGGSFIITLIRGTGYSIDSNSSITVSVADNDEPPVYSIASIAESVVEGNPAQFRITSPRASEFPVSVSVNITHSGDVIGEDHLRNSTTIASTQIAARALEKTFAISTEDDEIDEVDGSITGDFISG